MKVLKEIKYRWWNVRYWLRTHLTPAGRYELKLAKQYAEAMDRGREAAIAWFAKWGDCEHEELEWNPDATAIIASGRFPYACKRCKIGVVRQTPIE